jgi:sialate O-acetylesterase
MGPWIQNDEGNDNEGKVMAIRSLWLILALGGLFATALQAAVSLPAILSDGMVLQRDSPIRIWGKAEPGEPVSVAFRTSRQSAVADKSGRWQVFLPPQTAGGPDELKVSGRNELVLKDILVGELWVASGQSNMEWHVKLSRDPQKEIAAAHHPQIRLFHVPHRIIETPQDDVNAKWLPCTPENIPNFSAVAYYFGRHLQRDLKVPVGLIEAARGGTPAEAWMRSEDLHSVPELQYYIHRWTRYVAEYPEASRKYAADLSRWEAAGKDPATRPRAPQGPGSAHAPSVLYNGMIAPVTPMTIRGVIWYQGETNASRSEGYLYRTLFPALIEGWRAQWGQGRLPFLFVQLANYEGMGTEAGTHWAEVREAQLLTANRLRDTAMAVTTDVGDAVNIHPKNKQSVGDRLALAARSMVYGEAVTSSGPVYRRVTSEPQALRVWFDSLGGGLSSRDRAPLVGFFIAGTDRVFMNANAKIDGQSVVVTHPAVPAPVAVRYAWGNNVPATLMNVEGLPASPFRSDDWREAKMPELPFFGRDGWQTSLDPSLPNVLILGDSISIGYTREARYLLKSAANVVRPVEAHRDAPVNCTSTEQGLKKLSEWLGDRKWSVIHFNWGLHDLCYRHPDSKDPGKRDKVRGTISVPVAQYETNLRQIVKQLQATGACLVWANTTFVPEGEIGRFPGDERKYNEIAARVMKENGIPTDDLYTTTAGFAPPLFIGPGNVHFSVEANWILGRQVAQTIRTALTGCGGVRR